ncbi:hypothetical protein TrLO_g13869 [Triparma laevis f. longispina]|uniref:Cytochrome P450 n=1 Tax=Triparma laevis f. longispina TaxID=1714387 RepID=A0A9W7L0D2_9STRA|nr:hypothetical protein TrLO_g13869 [Triparma laevis f. longispina]
MMHMNHNVVLALYLVVLVLIVNCQFTSALSTIPTRLPPGPDSLPLLGSPSFISATIRNEVVQELVSTRRDHGPIFLVKTGPITQVWVDDIDLANTLFSMESAAGRSQLKKPVFGGDFLFLVRDVKRARTIRSNQKALLAERSSSSAVSSAVQSSNLPQIINDCLAVSSSSSISWPSKTISAAAFNALITLYIGTQPLSEDEVERLLNAVAGYRRRGPATFVQAIASALGISKKLSFTDEINELLDSVVVRANASPELLPLLVSATVGGAEIFPLLLQWSVLRLSVDKATQDSLYSSLLSNPGSSVPPIFLQAAAACARDCPVSAATGPPRKITETTYINNYEIPAEAICFAMHPGLKAADGVAPWEVGLQEKTWPIHLKGATGSWPMFGSGPRACPASEQSLNFIASSIAMLVRNFEWEVACDGGVSSMFEFEGDGSLLVPKVDTKLKFRKR